ncbi:MAG: hypothetical protein HY043_06600 [Verrucomicrobia bacterium]|nr:hypothetical protein [Verrucomicrobiota bacterium]
MKTILIFCAVILVAATAVFAWKFSHREDHFGKPFTGLPAAAIPDIVAKPDVFLGRQVSIQGKLKRQCPSTGCWFFLTDPADPKAQELKVEMGDTTPRLPSRMGRLAHLEGQFIKYGEGYEFIGVAVTFTEEHKP